MAASIVHEDRYVPGSRTPQPPIKRWKAPPRKVPPHQRPVSARCRGWKIDEPENDLATGTKTGTKQIPGVLPMKAITSVDELGGAGSSRGPSRAHSGRPTPPTGGVLRTTSRNEAGNSRPNSAATAAAATGKGGQRSMATILADQYHQQQIPSATSFVSYEPLTAANDDYYTPHPENVRPPCGDEMQNTERYLDSAKRKNIEDYNYGKFRESDLSGGAQGGKVAVGPSARVQQFVNRNRVGDDKDSSSDDDSGQEAEEDFSLESDGEDKNVRRRRKVSPTKGLGSSEVTKDPNYVNRYLYRMAVHEQAGTLQEKATTGTATTVGKKKMVSRTGVGPAASGGGPSKIPRTTSALAQTLKRQKALQDQTGMPGVGSYRIPTATTASTSIAGRGDSLILDGSVSAREARQHFQNLAKQLEAQLYAEEVEKVRREGIGQKPPMQLHALRVKTFDDNLPLDPVHRQLEDDIKRDEHYVKRKHLREAEIMRKAVLEQRVKETRKAHKEKMKASFERSLALGLPYTTAKAQEVVAKEWASQMEDEAVATGFNLNEAAKKEQMAVAQAKATQLLQGVKETLQSQQPSFGITPKEANAEATLAFLKSGQKRPQAYGLLGKESEKIVKSIKAKIPLRPPKPQLSCDYEVNPKSGNFGFGSVNGQNEGQTPIEAEYREAIKSVADLPDHL